MSKQPDITIVIPAYREEKRIGSSLDKLSRFLEKDSFFKTKNTEVIVVAADSPDRTDSVVRSRQSSFKDLKLLKPGKKAGKGRDVRYGMLRSRGRFVIFMDADLATPLKHLEEFYKSCAQGSDVVIGTRDITKHHANLIRRAISYTGNVLFRLVSGMWIEDSQCGFKMFSNQAADVCFSKLTLQGWSFDMEILVIAKLYNLNIKTIRIDDWVDVPGGTFNEGIVRVVYRSLKDLTHILISRVSRKNY